jgi:hypothetical protein
MLEHVNLHRLDGCRQAGTRLTGSRKTVKAGKRRRTQPSCYGEKRTATGLLAKFQGPCSP